MTKNHIRSKDLNLLKVFSLLLDEGSLSRAAARLGLTQPAVSRCLARLRDEFDDPLFVRAPGGVLPTAKALALEQPLREALARLEALYVDPVKFTPSTAKGIVRLATTDYFEQAVWVDLVGSLTRAAPGLTFVTLMSGSELPEAALRSGEVQLAIAGFFGELPSGFFRQTVLTDRFVTVLRRDHPLARKRLTLDAYTKLDHLIVSPRGHLDGAVDAALRGIGRSRRIAASVCSFLSSGPVVAASDLVLTAPERLVKRFAATLPLAVYPPPLDLPPINIVQVWHERFRHDPMHVWLRSAISATKPEAKR